MAIEGIELLVKNIPDPCTWFSLCECKFDGRINILNQSAGIVCLPAAYLHSNGLLDSAVLNAKDYTLTRPWPSQEEFDKNDLSSLFKYCDWQYIEQEKDYQPRRRPSQYSDFDDELPKEKRYIKPFSAFRKDYIKFHTMILGDDSSYEKLSCENKLQVYKLFVLVRQVKLLGADLKINQAHTYEDDRAKRLDAILFGGNQMAMAPIDGIATSANADIVQQLQTLIWLNMDFTAFDIKYILNSYIFIDNFCNQPYYLLALSLKLPFISCHDYPSLVLNGLKTGSEDKNRPSFASFLLVKLYLENKLYGYRKTINCLDTEDVREFYKAASDHINQDTPLMEQILTLTTGSECKNKEEFISYLEALQSEDQKAVLKLIFSSQNSRQTVQKRIDRLKAKIDHIVPLLNFTVARLDFIKNTSTPPVCNTDQLQTPYAYYFILTFYLYFLLEKVKIPRDIKLINSSESSSNRFDDRKQKDDDRVKVGQILGQAGKRNGDWGEFAHYESMINAVIYPFRGLFYTVPQYFKPVPFESYIKLIKTLWLEPLTQMHDGLSDLQEVNTFLAPEQ